MSYKITIESKVFGVVTRTTFETDSPSIEDVFEGFVGQLVSHGFGMTTIDDEIVNRSEKILQSETTIISDMDGNEG